MQQSLLSSLWEGGNGRSIQLILGRGKGGKSMQFILGRACWGVQVLDQGCPYPPFGLSYDGFYSYSPLGQAGPTLIFVRFYSVTADSEIGSQKLHRCRFSNRQPNCVIVNSEINSQKAYSEINSQKAYSEINSQTVLLPIQKSATMVESFRLYFFFFVYILPF